MGSYNRYYIDANVNNYVVIEGICLEAQSIDGEDITDAWRKWSESTKWEYFNAVAELSRKFPKIVFSCAEAGDYGYDKYFYLNGVSVGEKFAVPPKWPSKTDMDSGRVAQHEFLIQKGKRLKAEQITADKKAKADKIAKLEKELKQLKTG